MYQWRIFHRSLLIGMSSEWRWYTYIVQTTAFKILRFTRYSLLEFIYWQNLAHSVNPFHYCQKKLLMKNHAPKTGKIKVLILHPPNSLLLLVFLHTSLAFQGLSYTGPSQFIKSGCWIRPDLADWPGLCSLVLLGWKNPKCKMCWG